MAGNGEPCEGNGYWVDHVDLLCREYHRLTGRKLIGDGESREARARQLYEAPFFVATHDASEDPLLTYGNLTAQRLFVRPWEDFVGTPSRYTAEAPERAERQVLLETVAANGFIEDYGGVRVASDGRRFRIEGATVWNLVDVKGRLVGQGATFSTWTWL